jgi:ADP-ribose pyrophosphatase
MVGAPGQFVIRERHPLFSTRIVRFEALTVEGPSGAQLEREVVVHPGAVAVVPVTPGGQVVLIRQYRAAVDRELIEIPAGKTDQDGEAPTEAARRELEEETGWSAIDLELLGSVYTSPGFCDERVLLYLAHVIGPGQVSPQGEEEVNSELLSVPVAEIPALLESGVVCDAKSVAGLTLALARLGKLVW